MASHQDIADTVPLPKGPRPAFWGLLVFSLLVALAIPFVQLRIQIATPLRAQACVWPHSPVVGQPARILIALPDDADRVATAGSQGRVVAEWDMLTMRMGPYRATLTGSQDVPHLGVFAAPLRLEMVGEWVARVEIQAPGRPNWSATLRFSTVPSSAQSPAPTATPTGGGTLCA